MKSLYVIKEYKENASVQLDYKKLRAKALKENFENNNFLWKNNKITYKMFIIYDMLETPIGFIGYINKKNFKTKHNFLILNFYIDSKHQWKWIGFILYKKIEEKIIKKKFPIIRLHCKITETNIKSLYLFKKMGFIEIGEENFVIYDKKENKYIKSILLEKIIKKNVL